MFDLTGDLRHVLKTVGDQLSRVAPWHEKTRPTRLNFVVNDIDPELVARNILLLEMCQTLDPSNEDDMLLLWSVWYSMDLGELQHASLVNMLQQLLARKHKSPLCRWQFYDTSTDTSVTSIWSAWQRMKPHYGQTKQFRSDYVSKKLPKERPDNPFIWCLKERHRAARLDASQLVETEEQRVWNYEGRFVFNVVNQPRINPTMMRLHTERWCLHYGSNPIYSYMPFDR